MPSIEDHCRDCILKLGKPYKDVHEWLDAFAFTDKLGMLHRRKRHHALGVAEARRLFGPAGAEAAKIHIVADLRMVGWRTSDPFPRDEYDCLYWHAETADLASMDKEDAQEILRRLLRNLR